MHTEIRAKFGQPGTQTVYLAEVDRAGTPIKVIRDNLGTIRATAEGFTATVPGVFTETYPTGADALAAVREALVTEGTI